MAFYQDYLKTVVPSQLLAERGSNLLVINPGSANIRVGWAQQDNPLNIPHCIARRTSQVPKRNVQDQMLNSQVTTAQHMEREKAYDIIASLLKIPYLDEEAANSSFHRKMSRADAHHPHHYKETPFTWTEVFENIRAPPPGGNCDTTNDETSEIPITNGSNSTAELSSGRRKYKEYICGEDALRISPSEPYCLRRPIRRGHLNISQHYATQQVLEDLHTLWDWVLIEKLNIPHDQRHMYSAVLVVPETFDNREIKEMISIILGDLRFSSMVVHQEGLAAVFGNGLSTACVVNIGAQVTSVVCVEDGVALPMTQINLRYGGEDISRCLLWTQRHHQTWPPIRTDALAKPVDLLMLNKLRESYCVIREGEVEAVTQVHSYEDGMVPGSHKTRLTALNVPPMGLFYPTLLVPDVYPPPPRSWFNDYDDMLEDACQIDLPGTGAFPMWESYPVFRSKPKREDSIGLAEAITKSILSTGRIELQRKLFCSMQLIGGVALIDGLIPAVEERVLHAIPSHEAIDTVEVTSFLYVFPTFICFSLFHHHHHLHHHQVLQSRTNPAFVPWKGGAILGILDFTRDGWIHREDWIRNGIHIGSGRKYKDSYYIQAHSLAFINSS
ncbi:hypothetical protein DM860_002353 [Cuscuta australis]|uniref:Actin-related protein 9 n=1 Tax=Cuscuta australis TaxID=267555 RepID=A0A328CY24_9ASTE|nr:hypothetical protein DM860_002353 [Cuscuta australis]